MSGPDPWKPIPDATGVLRGPESDARKDTSKDTSFEADFADLAARFAAQSGGGLSAELSADLALEIVLNEVVEQACVATGATGAAIVLPRDGEMVCRASSGVTAPELGSRLDTAGGLSGECIKTRRTQRCDDVLADTRADVEASGRLGVRSVMVMPLLRGVELAGVLELFSSLPYAFGDRDERTLEMLADRIVSNLDRAAQPLELPRNEPVQGPEPVRVLEPLQVSSPAAISPPQVSEATKEEIPGTVENSPRRFDFVTAVLGACVLACAVLLGILLGLHFVSRKPVARVRPAVPTSSENSAPSAAPPTDAASAPSQANTQPGARPSSAGSVPPGGLLVFENGKEVFRLPPVQNGDGAEQDGIKRAAAVDPEKIVELSPAAAEGSLLHRVEPEYPEEARQQRVQGAVVLDVHIGGDGKVQDVQVVSGAPQLAQASSDAVKQWRFRPRRVGGHAVEMQTRVTLNFRLPQ